MDSDERFKHLVSDPRFRTLKKKQKKVVIDDRFKPMFEDKRFTLKYSEDKRGWRRKESSSDNLKKYYSLENENKVEKAKCDDVNSDDEAHLETGEKEEQVQESEDEDEDEEESKTDEETGLSDEEDEQSESDVSTSSDESESEVEEVDISEIKYDWQPLDHDAETADQSSNRLAIQNLDWDQLDVRDLYVLLNSIRPPIRVTIYVSEFGKERLAKEELNGPSELVEASKDNDEEEELRHLEEKMKAFENKGAQKIKPNEYEDADETMDFKDDEISAKVRRYQLNRMKYYYAIAEFDSSESAEVVYKELDGREFEGTSLELDLRFVPEDVEFDIGDVHSKCEKMPDLATYKAPLFINSALQQTSVRFTWDETDVKRQEKLRRAYTEKELDKDDLDAYLASESDTDNDSEDDEDANEDACDNMSVKTGNSEARTNKYKQLLANLDEEAERKKKIDVDVEWGDFEADSTVVKPAKPEPKVKRKPEAEKESELELLVMDESNKEGCEFNPDDKRFEAVYTSGEFNIDPSHPNFKRTSAFDIIAERKRQRRMASVAQLSAPKPK